MANGNRGGGKPEHKPTKASRQLVLAGAGVGIPQNEIATGLGITKNTLRKHYKDELDNGIAKTKLMGAGKLFENVMAGHPGSVMFFAKTRLGLRETLHLDNTSSDGTMTPKVIERVFVDPGKITDRDAEME